MTCIMLSCSQVYIIIKVNILQLSRLSCRVGVLIILLGVHWVLKLVLALDCVSFLELQLLELCKCSSLRLILVVL